MVDLILYSFTFYSGFCVGYFIAAMMAMADGND